MPSFAMPAIDATICANWPEQDQHTYNRLPFYLDKAEASERDRWETWEPVLTDTIDWKPNMGDTLKLVMTEQAPVIRQSARPNSIATEAKGDYFNVRERTSTASLVWQKFFSPKFRFLPNFQDFMKGQLIPTRKTIESQIRMFKEFFYRTYCWDHAPRVYVCGVGVVDAPVGVNADGTPKKTNAWIQSLLQSMAPTSGYLTYQEVYNIASVAMEEIGMEPYSGSSTPPGNGESGLNEQYCLIQSPESYLQFVNDPWVKENRALALDIVNSRFKPTPFGLIKSRLEKYPWRWKTTADLVPSEPAPEVWVTDQNSSEYNRRLPNPDYSKISNSPFELSWFLGQSGGIRRISVGAPPDMFAGGTGDPAKIAGMEWNGRVYATKNFPIQCADANGNTQLDLNSFGEYLRFQSALTLGAVAVNPHNVLPIICRRRRGITTTGLPGAGN